MGNEHRRRIVTMDEGDAYTGWRKVMTRFQRAGTVRAVKRDTWRRERREAATQIATETDVWPLSITESWPYVDTEGYWATKPDLEDED